MTLSLNTLKQRLLKILGEPGRAAAYWSGAAPDDRPPGTDALWYDTDALRPLDARYGEKVHERHLYLTMRDGAKIAISLYLPEQLPEGEQLPTLLNQTCYWRCFRLKWPFRLLVSGAPYFIRGFVLRGYAYVIVDVRGTGASSGARPTNRVKTENDDAREIVDWIVRQPWSDGRVGLEGVSYMGVSAAMTAALGHPAVAAVVPQFALHDAYEEFMYPGGVLCERIMRNWSNHAVVLQRGDPSNTSWFMSNVVAGLVPADEDRDGRLLAQALKSHASNGNTYDIVAAAPYRDSVLPGVTENGRPQTHETTAPYTYRATGPGGGPAFYEIAGWFDGGFLRGNINRHRDHAASPRNKLVIGPWDHGSGQNISPWSNSRRPAGSRRFEMLRFFDHHLKGLKVGVQDEPAVHYFTMGEEKWKASDVWPPSLSKATPFYFGDARSLGSIRPDRGDAHDSYEVDFETTTGINNRWQTIANLGKPGKESWDIEYPDRAAQQPRLLTYTTVPLAYGVEVTGHPVVVLHLACTTPDAAIHVYLEDVGPDGDVVYVTEGILRASHRALATPPYSTAAPWHPYRKNDQQRLKPGEPVELQIEMYATSYLFARGRSIRIGIAGADRDTFERVPRDGNAPVFTIFRDAARPSRVELPLMPSA